MGIMQRLQAAAAFYIATVDADDYAYLDAEPPIPELICGNVESVMLQSVPNEGQVAQSLQVRPQRNGSCAQGAS